MLKAFKFLKKGFRLVKFWRPFYRKLFLKTNFNNTSQIDPFYLWLHFCSFKRKKKRTSRNLTHFSFAIPLLLEPTKSLKDTFAFC